MAATTTIDARGLLLHLATVSFNTPKGDSDDPQSWVEAVKEIHNKEMGEYLNHNTLLDRILSLCKRDRLSNIVGRFHSMLVYVQLTFKCQR